MAINKTAILVIVIIAIVAAILFLSNPFKPKQQTQTLGEGGKKVGDIAFDLQFQTFDGKQVKFSNFRGKAVIANAWAGWCPFCVGEMPDLQAVSNKHDDLIILFIHRTATESKSKGQSFLDKFVTKGTPITDPVLEDPQDSFYNTFFGFGMPVTLFIDKNGVIKDRKVGSLTPSELEEKAAKIL